MATDDRDTLLLEIRGLAAALAERAKGLKDMTADDEHQFAVLVEIGHCLWEVVDVATAALEPLKTLIRGRALDSSKGTPGVVRYDGACGAICSVTVQAPTIKVRSDADIRALKQALGSKFALFFEEVTTYKPRDDFEALAVEDPKLAGVLTQAVEIRDQTPRVTFKR